MQQLHCGARLKVSWKIEGNFIMICSDICVYVCDFFNVYIGFSDWYIFTKVTNSSVVRFTGTGYSRSEFQKLVF